MGSADLVNNHDGGIFVGRLSEISRMRMGED
jgi:hypothetical protein